MSGYYCADHEGSDLILSQNGAGPKGFSRWDLMRQYADPVGPKFTEEAIRGILDEHWPGCIIESFSEDIATVLMPAPQDEEERRDIRIARQDIVDGTAELVDYSLRVE